MLFQTTDKNTIIKTEDRSLASGGEGVLYRILSPAQYRGCVAKIYHKNKRNANRERKIGYLRKYPPIRTQYQQNQHESVVWVKELLYDKAEFVGFIMPFVRGRKLEILCTTKLPRKIDKIWQRFALSASGSFELRLKFCFNLGAAVYQLHASKRYILVDLKPDNVIVQANGLVALVDTDSVEVLENGERMFDAPVATPEYTPPEYYTRQLSKDPTTKEEWDRFSLAVILYKLLFGIHPYAASCRKPYEKATDLARKIELGLFVHAPDKQRFFHRIPKPHQHYQQLPQSLQALFERCFIDGHFQPKHRPSAEEWCSVIATYLRLGAQQILPSRTVKMPTYSLTAPQKKIEPALGLSSKLPSPKIQKQRTTNLVRFGEPPSQFRLACFLTIVLGILGAIGTGLGGGVLFLAVGASLWMANLPYSKRKEVRVKMELKEKAKALQRAYIIQLEKTKVLRKELRFAHKQFEQKQQLLPPSISANIHQTDLLIQTALKKFRKFLGEKDAEVERLYIQHQKATKLLYAKNKHLFEKHPIYKNPQLIDHKIQHLQQQENKVLSDLETQQERIKKELEAKYQKEKKALMGEKDEKRSVREQVLQQQRDFELQKALDKYNQQSTEELANVQKAGPQKLPKYAQQILRIFKQNGVHSINQIDRISKRGLIVLKNGKHFSLGRLKFNQLVDLRRWTQEVRLAEVSQLPAQLANPIVKKYDLLVADLRAKEAEQPPNITLLNHLGELEQTYREKLNEAEETYEELFEEAQAGFRQKIEPLEALLAPISRQREALKTHFQFSLKNIQRDCDEEQLRVKTKIDKLLTDNPNEQKQQWVQLLAEQRQAYEKTLKDWKGVYQELKITIAAYEKAEKELLKYEQINWLKHLENMLIGEIN